VPLGGGWGGDREAHGCSGTHPQDFSFAPDPNAEFYAQSDLQFMGVHRVDDKTSLNSHRLDFDVNPAYATNPETQVVSEYGVFDSGSRYARLHSVKVDIGGGVVMNLRIGMWSLTDLSTSSSPAVSCGHPGPDIGNHIKLQHPNYPTGTLHSVFTRRG
jgi:hypothetical protein